ALSWCPRCGAHHLAGCCRLALVPCSGMVPPAGHLRLTAQWPRGPALNHHAATCCGCEAAPGAIPRAGGWTGRGDCPRAVASEVARAVVYACCLSRASGRATCARDLADGALLAVARRATALARNPRHASYLRGPHRTRLFRGMARAAAPLGEIGP